MRVPCAAAHARASSACHSRHNLARKAKLGLGAPRKKLEEAGINFREEEAQNFSGKLLLCSAETIRI